jgi:geranylgeranylglycerol-phosphate geranylgeranyltransferase
MTTLAIKQFPFMSFRFLKAYLITMRSYLMFVSGITGILGISFSSDLDLVKALLISVVCFLSYGFGQALTDCFQIDTDSISSPYRPLTQGIVKRNHFLVVSGAGLLFCISILTYYNPVNLLLGVIAGIGLATYTYFKRKWWAGPFYNSWIVLVLFLMAYLAGSGEIMIQLSNKYFIAAIITVFFGYANFVLSGYFKDIEADRATAYYTLPVVFDKKISARVSDVFGFIASASAVASLSSAFNSFPFQTIIKSFVFACAGIALILLTQVNLHSVRKDDEAHKAIVPCVHSYILLLSSLTVLNQPHWFIPLLLFYTLYNVVLWIRPAKNQI